MPDQNNKKHNENSDWNRHQLTPTFCWRFESTPRHLLKYFAKDIRIFSKPPTNSFKWTWHFLKNTHKTWFKTLIIVLQKIVLEIEIPVHYPTTRIKTIPSEIPKETLHFLQTVVIVLIFSWYTPPKHDLILGIYTSEKLKIIFNGHG